MTDGATPRSAGTPRRGSWVALLVLCLLWTGFGAGIAIASAFLVPAGSGLAGPAIAFGYGILGAVAGAILAGVAAVKLPASSLRAWALLALVPAIALAAIVAYRVATLPPPVGAGGDGLQPRPLTPTDVAR